MKVNYQTVLLNPLFHGITPDELKGMLQCLQARVASYDKDDFLILEGDSVDSIGILLSGSVAVLKEGEAGSRFIISALLPGDCFGETFACSNQPHSIVSVQALESCEVLFLDCRRIITTCSSACTYHTLLIANMMSVLTDKIRGLNEKLDILSKRKIRDRLMAFLGEQKKNASSNRFGIPYNREQLADYLFVDRSALSSELCKMREEGLLSFRKNQFEIFF